MAIALLDILDERHIALWLKSRRQANTLREIIGLLEKTGSVLQPADFLAQVLARERVNSTLLENGVAFPHAARLWSTKSPSRLAVAALEFHGTIKASALV